MLCFVALFVFLVLSIFSAKYRPLARRAIDCVVKKVTLRPCETGLDDEIKAASIAGIMKIHAPTAGFVNRHFEAFSLLGTAIFFLSMFFMLQGFYFFILYGNCNGPEGGFCIYSGLQNKEFLKAPTSPTGIHAGNVSANITLIEFGCYTCNYTKAAEDGVRRIIKDYPGRVHYVFKAFPIPSHPHSQDAVVAALCANDQGRYWDYRQQLFENQAAVRINGTLEFDKIASDIGLNTTEFSSCFASGKFNSTLLETSAECTQSGIFGTPTFFVNGAPFVGKTAMNDTEAEIKRLLGA
jgi:protein-disulfide isomerase